MIQNKLGRSLIFSSGVLSLVVGVVGIFLPILPTTPFILLAATCFVNSSPKVYHWLRKQPMIGQALMKWQDRGAISRSNKIQAILLIIISLVLMWLKIEILAVKIGVSIILLGVSIFLVSRPE